MWGDEDYEEIVIAFRVRSMSRPVKTDGSCLVHQPAAAEQ